MNRQSVARAFFASMLIALVGMSARVKAQDCEAGYTIDSVLNDGKIITLNDGSVWEVDDADTADSATWVSGDEIVVCSGKLVNTDEDETVDATRIK